jgi:hypothetical protein
MDSFYKSIDRLRARVDANKKIKINDACYILWAELCVCSTQYLDFKKWVEQNNVKGNFTWDIWKGIFYAYLDSLTKEENKKKKEIIKNIKHKLTKEELDLISFKELR